MRIESLLSARLFLRPQWVGDRIYFLSNLSGYLSLYVMDEEGSIPEPLLPAGIALQNPDLLGGEPYRVFPELKKILVMIDHDGDENYQPMLIPIDGGYPEPAFDNFFASYRVSLIHSDPEQNVVYFTAESRTEQMNEAFQGNLKTNSLTKMGASPWGAWIDGVSPDHRRATLLDNYTVGDNVLFLWEKERGEGKIIYGKPLRERGEQETVKLNAIHSSQFTKKGLLFLTSLFEDTYSLGYLDLEYPEEVKPVSLSGVIHQGEGEMVALDHLVGEQYLVGFNIDGVSWFYEASFDEEAMAMKLEKVVVGEGKLQDGVLESIFYDPKGDRYALAFSSATSPLQIFTISRMDGKVIQRTKERTLGLDLSLLSPGEDASFTSFDGMRISARLYLPNAKLGFTGPRPLVYYIHGGPQSQERPDFAWFSMPLIQFLTLNGFAVFVPNVRGSTGYGLRYTKQVDRDWGGQDRLDHVHAMKMLKEDTRIDTSRAAVVGRSYGGYMTLTLAARHPELWKAAVDMFGPFDLLSFLDRIPPTWKPYFKIALGDPEQDRDFLVERSPRTYIDQVSCPLLIIQGKNDPRVVEAESRDLVEKLRELGKEVDYLVFENEGHDVLKYENRVRCYNAITDFFKEHLRP